MLGIVATQLVNTARQGRLPAPPPRSGGPARAREGPDVAELPQRPLARPRSPPPARSPRSCPPRRSTPPRRLMALSPGLRRRALPLRHRGRRRARPDDRERRAMKVGIVGMPNAGKSSLFNALTKAGAEAANYPFTTIEPNVAVVPVARRAPRRGRRDRARVEPRPGHDRLPRHRRPGPRRPRGRGPGQPVPRRTSARPTRSSMSCGLTTIRTSSTPRGWSIRSATPRRSRPS